MSQSTKESAHSNERDIKNETSWAKCAGSASLVFTLLAVGFIWLVNKMDD
jgi:hypothetical protein